MNNCVPVSFAEAFRGKEEDVAGVIKADDDFLEALVSSRLINNFQKGLVQSEETELDRNRKLIDELKRANDDKVEVFFHCLVANGQRDVVEEILGYQIDHSVFVPGYNYQPGGSLSQR